MLTMDVFKGDAFSAISMTQAVEKVGFIPGFLGAMPGLFVPQPVTTTSIMIEERENAPALIQTSSRGEPPSQEGGVKRKVRSFPTLRLAKGSRITASEIQNIRAFGSDTELQTLQGEMASRMAKLRGDIELTLENMRLGCVQGLVVDADSSTLYDWATEFGQSIPAEIDFDLDNAAPASGVVRKNCNAVVRSILTNLKGLGGNAVRVHAICGDNFWDDLTAHKEVRETYLNTQAAAALREGNAYESFNYGGITWTNYRGSSGVAVNTDKARFFPVGAGIFQIAWSPGESFELANTLGRPVYSQVIADDKRNAYVDLEVFSYPLPVCTVPAALHRAKRT